MRMSRFFLLVLVAISAAYHADAMSSDRFYLRVANDHNRPVEISFVFDEGFEFFGSVAVVSVSRYGVRHDVQFFRYVWDVAVLEPGSSMTVLHFGTQLLPLSFSRSFLPNLFRGVELRVDDDRYVVSADKLQTLPVRIEPLGPTMARYVIEVSELIRVGNE